MIKTWISAFFCIQTNHFSTRHTQQRVKIVKTCKLIKHKQKKSRFLTCHDWPLSETEEIFSLAPHMNQKEGKNKLLILQKAKVLREEATQTYVAVAMRRTHNKLTKIEIFFHLAENPHSWCSRSDSQKKDKREKHSRWVKKMTNFTKYIYFLKTKLYKISI